MDPWLGVCLEGEFWSVRSMWKMYKELLSSVEPQVKQLQSIFQQAKAKTTERIWIRNRSDGELDDMRLVEGVAGERLVFKKRAKAETKSFLEDERRVRSRMENLDQCGIVRLLPLSTIIPVYFHTSLLSCLKDTFRIWPIVSMGLFGVRAKRRICFVMDCSGSMYRFNSLDGRLNRMLETTCLIFESMEGLDRYEAR